MQASDAASVAQITDLHVTFSRGGRDISALRGVNLELRRGEIFGLVGESGSGKTVLGLTILGLLNSDPGPKLAGQVSVCGVNMLTASPRDQRRIRAQDLGAVFQDPMTSLNPTMRVGRQLREVCGTDAEAVRLLESVGVPEARSRLRSFPFELSGGLRQRVMIAIAIAGSPKLVVADEPTTSLDVTVQAQILDLIRDIRDDLGTTFVLVTHDLGVAAQISDRIGVLYGGRLAEVGPATQLLAAPMHPYTSGLLRSRLTMESDRTRPLLSLPGEPLDPRLQPPGCPFAPRCEHAADECNAGLPPLLPVNGSANRLSACVRVGEILSDSLSAVVLADDPSRRLWVVKSSGEEQAPFALQIKDVTKSFATRDEHGKKCQLKALRGVDLEVREGEALSLVGESGCGKSTLLRVVAGLVSADSGSITIGPGARPQMVFQDAGASLTPWLSVGALLGERLREEKLSRNARSERINDTLRLVGLTPEIASAKAGQLSGGQRQRVGIARAIVVPPEILLCDEPTSALDVSLAATVLNLLHRLRRQFNMAMLFVTHDLAAARVVADRVAVMYLGQIVEEGAPEDVATNPMHPYTRALLAAVPSLGARQLPLKGEPASPVNPPSGCAFFPRCPDALEQCRVEPPPFLRPSAGESGVACWVHGVGGRSDGDTRAGG